MSRTLPIPALGLLLLSLAPHPAWAEVVAAEAHGFQVRREAIVSVDPQTVFDGFASIGEWWDPAHSFSGDPGALTLDTRPRGCLCESLEEGGGVVHLTVVHSAPGRRLVLTGGLGPLQDLPVAGTMVWTLEPDGASAEAPAGAPGPASAEPGTADEPGPAGEGTTSDAASAGGTRLTLTYGVTGFLEGGLAGWAGAVDGVLGEQVDRFVRWLETGSPEPGGSQ